MKRKINLLPIAIVAILFFILNWYVLSGLLIYSLNPLLSLVFWLTVSLITLSLIAAINRINTMVLDGLTINFTSTAVWTNGQPLVADFTAVSNSKTYSFRFTVAANGGSPAAGSFNIPDHPSIFFQLVKETSDNLIKCYEGSTEGVKNSGAKQSGSLNVIVSSKTNTWIGLSRDAASNSSTVVSGTITGTVINCDCGPETTVKGTFSNDEIKGTYKGSDNSGTWSAKRTL